MHTLTLLGADIDRQHLDLLASARFSLEELLFLSCHRLENTDDAIVRALAHYPELKVRVQRGASPRVEGLWRALSQTPCAAVSMP